ncbi:MAG: MBL fold metallo-hydrolase [Gemmatimonadota bacterium]|nr:MBL fold metallo-hydrolase [Gemmatimonadota bacterium]
MATLHVLGSGSRGNCCAIEADGAVILVDAGFSAREVERRAQRAGLDLGTTCGIALTHEHGDHAQGAVRLADRLRVPIVASAGTLAALKSRGSTPRLTLSGSAPRELGPFLVEGASTSHDAAEPMALAVSTTDGLRIGYATDLGRPNTAVRWLFRNLSAVVLEANYDEVLLRTSPYPVVVQQRIAGFSGHLSNGDAAELLRELFHPGLQAVVLAHLSQQCNTPDHARDAVAVALREAGFQGRLEVAGQALGMDPIELTVEWAAGAAGEVLQQPR